MNASLQQHILTAALALALTACATERTVTILHFSDYHSHAVPFFSEGERDSAGIARAIAYLREHSDEALIFSGGDMMNKGAPPWSDKYRCVEWPWLNGLVDAMAVGNHDLDYGVEEFARCARSTKYPLLSANTTGLAGVQPYVVLSDVHVRVGVFAIAGPDFTRLVKASGVTFSDGTAAARDVVATLRGKEKADLVVMIGHENPADDEALARSVPGIDLILGTHGHDKMELKKISGTDTWTIAPFQYLTYVSKVRVDVAGHKVTRVRGELVRMSASTPQDPDTASRVARLQKELELDPQYASLFRRVGTLEETLTQEEVGDLVTGIMRHAADADFAFSTASSFRHALPAGEITEEDLLAALPYPNRIVLFTLTGAEVQRLLDISASFAGSDLVARVSFRGRPPIDPNAKYLVATTDYMAGTAEKYRDFFAPFTARDSGLEVREEVRKHLIADTASPDP